jgi:phosphoribosylformylglycinamidine synthase
VVGILEDAALAVSAGLRAPGDVVLLAGDGPAALDGSEYQKRLLGEVAGEIPEPDLAAERSLHEFLAAAAAARLLQSAHDVSSGGLAVALAEAAILGRVGIDAPAAKRLFEEGEGRVVVSARSHDLPALRELAGALPLRELGTVGGDRIVAGAAVIGLAEATGRYESAVPELMGDA